MRTSPKASVLMSRVRAAGPALLVAGLPVGVGAVLTVAYAAMPPVPVPVENPITEPKRVLGKILFWDEQLSTSNAMSCGSCHMARVGGSDPRVARNPGNDGLLNTPDDKLASPGVIRSDAGNNYERDPIFAFNPQITPRSANSPINAAYATDLFWDGRARSRFVDPESLAVVINAGGALESQAVAPPVSDVEMAHEGFDFAGVSERLGSVRPLDLSTAIPADVAGALASNPTYPALFEAAFGDPAINAVRIAFAIATYQRTLISDQTPWDRFDAGDPTALNAQQVRGLNVFNAAASRCNACHTAPVFTNNTFRNIGIRPPGEDLGRFVVTGVLADRGRFKVPSLRNVGLKPTFMHNGQFSTLTDVIRFYARAPGSAPQFVDNIDGLMAGINIPPAAQTDLEVFLRTALTDPRVQNQTFPFDKPTLFAERPGDRPTVIAGGVAGSGGFLPSVIVDGPGLLGSRSFRVGLFNARGGSNARLTISLSPPVGGRLVAPEVFPDVTLPGAGNGAGVATQHWALSPLKFSGGQIIFAQWSIDDPAAPGGEALSNVARIPIFCGSSGCVTACQWGDLNFDGSLDLGDFFAFFDAYDAQAPAADLDGVPGVDLSDFFAFFGIYDAGC